MAKERKAVFKALCVVFWVLSCVGCSNITKDDEIRALRKELNQLKTEVHELKRRIERRVSTERPGHVAPASVSPTGVTAARRRTGDDSSVERTKREGRPTRPSREEIEARRKAMRDPEMRKKIMEEHRARMEERRRQHEERRRQIENSIKSNKNTENNTPKEN